MLAGRTLLIVVLLLAGCSSERSRSRKKQTWQSAPKPAASAMATSIINVSCEPSSFVWVDDKPTGVRTAAVGSAPVMVTAGRHSVSCRGDNGRFSAPATIKVDDGETASYKAVVPD